MSVNPLACTEDGSITWIARAGCTEAQARSFCAGEAGALLADFRVRRCHIRHLDPGDCPVHPKGERGEWDESEDCRCYEIEEGWWDECSHRHPEAVPCWRVEAK